MMICLLVLMISVKIKNLGSRQEENCQASELVSWIKQRLTEPDGPLLA
ncbi:MAG: hypothetical protein LW829_12440 [Luteolibacter sp.]|nr:hypothetical protein [Luteolibacter sp.]